MNENNKKNAVTDRRIRRTRTLLRQGLIHLMETKDIKDISVKELTDLVDINRGTFYLHYTDIYDMLDKIENEIFQEFNDILDRDIIKETQSHSPNEVLTDIFVLLDRNRDIGRIMLGPHGDLAFVNRLKNLVEERTRYVMTQAYTAEQPEYLSSFIISGCVGIIETWLNHPNPLPPEELAALCGKLLCQVVTG